MWVLIIHRAFDWAWNWLLLADLSMRTIWILKDSEDLVLAFMLEFGWGEKDGLTPGERRWKGMQCTLVLAALRFDGKTGTAGQSFPNKRRVPALLLRTFQKGYLSNLQGDGHIKTLVARVSIAPHVFLELSKSFILSNP